MDTCLWGPRLWSLLDSIVRLLNPGYVITPLVNKEDISNYRKNLNLLLYSLRYVLPCRHCRDSFRIYIKESPPEKEQDIVAWLWKLKNRVQQKLNRPQYLTLDQYRKRLLIWTYLIDVYQLWDLFTIIIFNYPKNERRKEDDEFDRKRLAYYIFFYLLSQSLLRYQSNLLSMLDYISPLSWTKKDVRDRIDMIQWLNRKKMEWTTKYATPTEKEAIIFSENMLIKSIL